MYAIVVDYYHADPEEKLDYITKPCYLGICYPPMNIYVFDEEHNSRSFRWGKKEDAEKYLAEHKNLHESCCYENIRVEEVEVNG